MWDPDDTGKYDKDLYGILGKPVKSIPTGKPECFVCFSRNLDQSARGKAARILAKHKAHATFFVGENSVKTEKGELRKLVAAGHALGNPTTADKAIDEMKGLKIGSFIHPIQGNIVWIDKPVAALVPENKFSWNVWAALNYFSLAAIVPGHAVSDAETAGTAAGKAVAGDIIMIDNAGAALDALDGLLGKLAARGLRSETIGSGFRHSTDRRLRMLAKDAGAKVETGRE
jgi:hypothetical protein